MLHVLSIREIADQIIPLDTCEELRTIALLRMVCVHMYELFKSVVTEHTKTQYEENICTAVVYSCRRFYARGPYRERAVVPDLLQKIAMYGESMVTDPEYAGVIHQWTRGVVGFDLEPEEFVDLNRLFGIKSSAYKRLWTVNRRGYKGEVKITYARDDHGIVVEVGGVSHTLYCCPSSGDSPSVNYLFYGHIHVCAADIGDYDNLQRMTPLTW